MLQKIPESENDSANRENEGNLKRKYLQNHDKRLDMGKHTFILINHFLYCCPSISLRKYFGCESKYTIQYTRNVKTLKQFA